jgi:hypothetical protein
VLQILLSWEAGTKRNPENTAVVKHPEHVIAKNVKKAEEGLAGTVRKNYSYSRKGAKAIVGKGLYRNAHLMGI